MDGNENAGLYVPLKAVLDQTPSEDFFSCTHLFAIKG